MGTTDIGMPAERNECPQLVLGERRVTTGSYYHYLRKIRESMLTEKEIVPLKKPRTTVSEGIRIESGELCITVSANVSPEMVAAILGALKSC